MEFQELFPSPKKRFLLRDPGENSLFGGELVFGLFDTEGRTVSLPSLQNRVVVAPGVGPKPILVAISAVCRIFGFHGFV